jgi:hypothetical protein
MDGKKTGLWALAAVLIAALLAGPVACTMHRQRLVAEAIKNGADPLAAKCAIEGDGGDSRTILLCMAFAMQKR